MKRLLLLLVAVLATSGCLAPKSFLDPKFRGIGYQDIQVPASPTPVKLVVTGERNGSIYPKASAYWNRQVTRVLQASRVFDLDHPTAAAELRITINNVGDVGAAAGKGFVTGLTFGAVGSLVTDGYVMTVDFTDPGGRTFSRSYQHAIYTTIGNASAPEGISPVTPSEAPSLVAEDMVLHFLKDYQKEASGK